MDKIVVPLQQLRKIMDKLKTYPDDTEIKFEFLLTALFPSVWNNIQEEMNRQYTQGYIQGKKDSENEKNPS